MFINFHVEGPWLWQIDYLQTEDQWAENDHSYTVGSNTDGSFTMANSNSFLSPYKILLDQENKYLGFFSYFIMTLYVECTH